jgi:V8-like Glu-specific endopeptidase
MAILMRTLLLSLYCALACASCGTHIPAFSDTLRAELAAHRAEQEPMPEAADELRFVCRLTVSRALSGPHFGSAALVEGGLLLTAAHNVASHPLNRIERVVVVCGDPDVREAERSLELAGDDLRARVFVADGYGGAVPLLAADYERDYAFIDVQDHFPAEGFALATERVAPGEQVYVAGYPGGTLTGCDRNADTCAALLYRGSAPAPEQPDDLYLRYAVDTHTGNSGAPVYRRSDAGYEIVGVHISGQSVGGNGFIGVARRVDDLVLHLREASRRRRRRTRPRRRGRPQAILRSHPAPDA